MAKIRFELRPLRELLLSGISKTSIRNALKRFSCKRDEDVESFLKWTAPIFRTRPSVSPLTILSHFCLYGRWLVAKG